MSDKFRDNPGNAPDDGEERFLNQVREELDRSCDRLDGHTRSRLNSIRHAAIEHGRRHPGRVLLAPFGGLVTASVLVLVVSLFFQQRDARAPAVPDGRSAVEDLDILTSAESLELFENLEFYQWLEENETSV